MVPPPLRATASAPSPRDGTDGYSAVIWLLGRRSGGLGPAGGMAADAGGGWMLRRGHGWDGDAAIVRCGRATESERTKTLLTMTGDEILVFYPTRFTT